MNRLSLKFWPFLALLFATAAAPAAEIARDQALSDLRAVKAKTTMRLRELEQIIDRLLSPAPAETLVRTLHDDEIETLSAERQEQLLRQNLLDRLILQVDTKFKNGNLKDFLADRLTDMARNDLLSTSSRQAMWKQMIYLSQTLRDLPDRGENVVAFIDAYLQQSPFKQPLKPAEFMKSREYTNGRESMAAKLSDE